MSRGPRGPRKRIKPTRARQVSSSTLEHEDDDEDLRNTPGYRRRQMLIKIGVSFLVVAFLSTSGITCVATEMSQSDEQQQQQQAQHLESQAGGVALNTEIARYQDELKKNPSDTETQRLLAQCLVLRSKSSEAASALKDVAEAQTYFEAVLKSEPENMQVWIGLGNVNTAQNKPEKALEAYGQALHLASKPIDPKAPDKDSKQAEAELILVQAHMGQARVHYEIEKKYDLALKNLDEALKINSGEADAYLLRARIQIDRKQPEAARRDLGLAQEIAMQLPPGSQEQTLILGQYLAAMKILDPSLGSTPTATPVSSTTPQNTTENSTNTTLGNVTSSNITQDGNTTTP